MWLGSVSERRERMREVIRCLEGRFSVQRSHPIEDSFSLLVATILSQNTSSRNSSRAFSNLQSSYDVKPEVLAKLRPEELKPYIEVAGLHEVRSRRIIEVSREVLERFGGDLDNVLQLPLDEARRALMGLEGVGPKTADILLAFRGGCPVMPVDTNIFRVAERLGLVRGRVYERTRAALEELIPEDKMGEMHFALLRLGREVCKPRRPLCPVCPVNTLCDYPEKTRDN